MASPKTVELSSPACYASESYYGDVPPPTMTDPRELNIAVIGAGMTFTSEGGRGEVVGRGSETYR